jgi:CDP-diacylglycerol--serine O-phosphatidyltransferase
MNIKRFVPNFLTLLNLFCGCIAIIFVADLKFDYAFLFVCLGIFFDFFDGFLARKFKVSGPLGVQLDSLADMVTSGVVPGFVMFCLLSKANFSVNTLTSYLGFVITLGACYRLAKFNIDTRQSDSFIGLPTPANTLFIMSLPLIIDKYPLTFWSEILTNQWVLFVIIALSTYVMNAEIPLFSLKFKDFSFNKYMLQISFLLLSILLIFTLQFLAFPLIIISYVIISVMNNIISKK